MGLEISKATDATLRWHRALALSLMLAAPVYAQQPVTYHVSFPEAQHHRMQVEVIFPDVPPGTLEVMMSTLFPYTTLFRSNRKSVV